MKKLFTLLVVAILAITGANAQNLLTGWDANGATGANTEANKWGWACTYASTAWGTANGAGIRYVDLNATSSPIHLNNDGSTFIGRAFLFRWDGSYWGSTYTLGKGDGASTTQSPINLTACKSYTFNANYEWWNNGTQPTYSFSFVDAVSGNVIATVSSTSMTTKNKYQPVTLTFTCPATGTYFLQIKQISGTGSGNGTLIGVNGVNLVESTTQSLNVTPTSLSFDYLTKSRTFTVSGNMLTSDVALVAPAGITLDKTTVTAAEAQCGAVITATYDGTSTISNGNINITSGTLSQTVTVNAVPTSATSAIVNPSFESSFAGWTNNGMVTQTNASFDPYKAGSIYVEKWTGTAPLAKCGIEQTVSGLLNGLYTLTASGHTTLQSASTNPGGAYIFGNKDSVEVFAPGDYSVTVKVTDGKLKLGFHSYTSGNWVALDNFRLTALPSIIATGTNASQDSVLFTATGQQISIPVSTQLFTNGLTITSSDPTNFAIDITSLPNTGGTVNVTFNGAASMDGNLTISSVNPASPVPGLQRVAVGGTNLVVPLKAVLVPTKVENQTINGFRSYIQNDDVITEFNLEKNAPVRMTIFGVNGVKLAERFYVLNAGANSISINKELSSGIYLVTLNIDGKSVTQKIVK